MVGFEGIENHDSKGPERKLQSGGEVIQTRLHFQNTLGAVVSDGALLPGQRTLALCGTFVLRAFAGFKVM